MIYYLYSKKEKKLVGYDFIGYEKEIEFAGVFTLKELQAINCFKKEYAISNEFIAIERYTNNLLSCYEITEEDKMRILKLLKGVI